jgi:ABC-type glycerol-3-phosphate transport system permease component
MARKAVLIIVCVLLLSPTYLLVKGSFESTMGLVKMPPTLIPRAVSLQSYVELSKAEYFFRWMLNSVTLTSFVVVGATLLTMMAGFAFLSRFPGHRVMVGILLISSAIPAMVLYIPRYLTLHTVGLSGGFFVAALPLMYSPMGALFARAWMMQIGPSFCEEARMEGCSEWQVLWHVALPMSKPIIGYMVIGQGLAALQDFLWQTLSLPRTEEQTMMVGLWTYITSQIGFWKNSSLGIQFAAGTILLVPMIGIFLVGQRWFVGDGKGLIL